MGAKVIIQSMGGLPTRSAHGIELICRRGTQSCLDQLNHHNRGIAGKRQLANHFRLMIQAQSYFRLTRKAMIGREA